MTDPLGIISSSSIRPVQPGVSAIRAGTEGPSFKDQLSEQLRQVDQLQKDADVAAEDLVAGRRDDFEGVMIAMKRAETAFNMLLAVRNKMMEAYEEVKQIRV